MGVVVEVRAARAVVQEPGLRLRRGGHALDEPLGVGGPLVVEAREHRDRDFLDHARLAALLRVHPALVERQVLDPAAALLAVHHFREEVGITPFGVHVRDAEEAEEVVEPDVLRLRLRVLAHVPLADGLRRVAGVGEELRQGDFALQSSRHSVHRRDQEPVPHRQPPGHERGTRRRARGLGVARREQQPVAREAVDVGRRRAGHLAAAVAAEIAPADVVHQHDQDVRFAPGAPLELRELARGLRGLRGVRKGGLAARTRRDRLGRDRIEGHASRAGRRRALARTRTRCAASRLPRAARSCPPARARSSRRFGVARPPSSRSAPAAPRPVRAR